MADKELNSLNEMARTFFISGQYLQALQAYRKYENETKPAGKDLLRVKKNILICLANVVESEKPSEDLKSSFSDDLQCYLQTMASVPDNERALRETIACFEEAIIPFLRKTAKNGRELGKQCLQYYKDFLKYCHTEGIKLGLLKAWNKQVVEERIACERPGYFDRTIGMARTLYETLKLEKNIDSFAADIAARLAELEYSYPDEKHSEEEQKRNINSLITFALEKNPEHPFARKLQEHLKRLSIAMVQINQFHHDTNSRMGRLRQRMITLKSMANNFPQISEELALFEHELDLLRASGSLIKQVQPGTDAWRTGNPVADIAKMAVERWPGRVVFDYLGQLEPNIEYLPAYVKLAFEHLINNSFDAYQRKKMQFPEPAVKIDVDSQNMELRLRDWAGGIDPHMGNIFEPYKSSKGISSETGLGLVQTSLALKAMSWEIFLAQEQPDDGALFIIKFKK